ncbi:MAG: hypothetical protein AB8G95_21865 [Anaerolineae bacterium]
MTIEQNQRIETIQGVGQLAVDTVLGITDLVDTMHRTIISFGGRIGDPDQTQTTGIAGMVYAAVRNVTAGVGKGLNISLNQLSLPLTKKEEASSNSRETLLAALNGVFGDSLVAKSNPLAISMGFRHAGATLSDERLAELMNQADGKVVMLVHGSCMNDLQWDRNGHDHGVALAHDLGLTPIYLHYNSGLHTSENGKILADLLEATLALANRPIGFHILAHSMGGLVARSAIYYGKQAGHSWPAQLNKLVFLGTPHHGAPLERGGNWIDNILEVSPYSTPFAQLGKIRSSGVTDLRYGNVVDDDWQGADRFIRSGDSRTPVPLPDGIECYAIAGSRIKLASKISDRFIGDGLVPVDSALGHHQANERQLLFHESNQWIGRGISHLDLLSHPTVYETLKIWLADENG